MKRKLAVRYCTGEWRWFAVIEEKDGCRLWVPLARVASTSLQDALGCYRLALMYFGCGILHTLIAQGVRENDIDAELVDLKELEERQLLEAGGV